MLKESMPTNSATFGKNRKLNLLHLLPYMDEVAIPVLCTCSRDDPVRGEPQATLPWELFDTNPHFFLLLTALGGHCGFSFPEEGPALWSHQAVLEFFRATTGTG